MWKKMFIIRKNIVGIEVVVLKRPTVLQVNENIRWSYYLNIKFFSKTTFTQTFVWIYRIRISMNIWYETILWSLTYYYFSCSIMYTYFIITY